jgi:hypothetical protein
MTRTAVSWWLIPVKEQEGGHGHRINGSDDSSPSLAVAVDDRIFLAVPRIAISMHCAGLSG